MYCFIDLKFEWILSVRWLVVFGHCIFSVSLASIAAKFKTLWYQILIGLLNIMKSQLSPVQVIDWLGFTLDLREGCFSVLNSKLIICCMQLLPVS